MADIYGLTAEDVKFLKGLKRDVYGGRVNPPSARVGYDGYDDGHQAPETYIALVPVGGIPACEPVTGTGIPDYMQGDIPGTADCYIYRVISGSIYSVDFYKPVLNLTSSQIDQQWITVVRDKYGSWIAQVGGTPCEDRNEVWNLAFNGVPLGGYVSLTFEINEMEETIDIDYDATFTEAKISFTDHSELTTGDVDTDGGPFPTTSIRVEFVGDQAGKPIRLTSFSIANLSSTPGTGTVGDLDGVGFRVERWQPGFSAT